MSNVQDVWLANLRLIVDFEAPGTSKRPGFRAVATRTGLSEEYLYQLYVGKRKKDGSPRVVGLDAARAIDRAYANGRQTGWFDQPMSPDFIEAEGPPPHVPESSGLRIAGPGWESVAPAPLLSAIELMQQIEARVRPLTMRQREMVLACIRSAVLDPNEAVPAAADLARLFEQPIASPATPQPPKPKAA